MLADSLIGFRESQLQGAPGRADPRRLCLIDSLTRQRQETTSEKIELRVPRHHPACPGGGGVLSELKICEGRGPDGEEITSAAMATSLTTH